MMTDELKAMCGDASLNCLYAFSELAENADRKIAEQRKLIESLIEENEKLRKDATTVEPPKEVEE